MARPRVTSISPHREPQSPSRQQGPGGMERRPSYLANGVLHPSHMAEPGQDGYRTPTGEDFGDGTDEAVRMRQQVVDRLDAWSPLGNDEAGSRRGGRPGDMFNRALEESEEEDRERDGVNGVGTSFVRRRQWVGSYHPSKAGARRAGEVSNTGGGEMPSALATLQDTHARRTSGESAKLDWRQRLKHFTWSFFTITMATGGIANVLWSVPFRFSGLYEIGCVFFLLNVVLFVVNVVCISLRFYHHPSTFRNSFLHPTESLFVPAAVVSFGTILLNISQYGTGHVGHWLNDVVRILFWVDVGLAVISSFSVYLLFWTTQTFTIATMTPVWIFPVYPLLIIGPHAAVLSSTLERHRSAQILVGGFTTQGIGLLVSLMIYSAYIYRLMTQKLPLERLRPGMFVSVGPSAFTAAGLSNMANNAQRTWSGTDFMGNGDLAAMILRVVGDWSALWFWALALWFFFIAVGAHHTMLRRKKNIPFAMTWFSFVFPQTALVTATFAIGRAFDLFAVQVLGCVMAVGVVAMWLFVVTLMLRAVYVREILWPQVGEDKDEGGFKGDPEAASQANGGEHVADGAAYV